MFSEACLSVSGRLFCTVATMLGGIADWRRENSVWVFEEDDAGDSVAFVGVDGEGVLSASLEVCGSGLSEWEVEGSPLSAVLEGSVTVNLLNSF